MVKDIEILGLDNNASLFETGNGCEGTFAKAIAETSSSRIKDNKKNFLIEIFMIKNVWKVKLKK